MNENHKMLNAMIGLATLGSSVTGIVSFLAAMVTFLSGEFVAAGACLAAAALSFGLLANAVLRK
jgi:hypothetical protein